ncbi:NAD-dependent succinate-semialdehyde dehydrogenase [Moraxella catarrhalis]|uniref:NAD-dependent succinate-semialdehyde dehydrogenase n=2 Tax=Moraxella catarrhalis TaxID=480 RepID=UPI00128B1BFE|nr:NAD-dependent succinate-semialdehyde dehydrogenase [Moraxella catarrhalis]MPW62637.1 NAD-dependent succinate-semialdehyde dehydrogenase [Moraxella catarrhalis]MPX39291.1 succinate-semialdehyde dehydrogenase (NADP(+)) [Moraxella catarrhalis]MPX54195.1 NAD-dependent succinate-semialdehyde dehydrogenase [Moraxella catarrhalis]MPX59104.1 succinate-semialdehyde dehydrogenase (NADP(+)) [Moraxella catarrhalis]MPX79949.1 succinate-semialdehyde dehydrogenase (NADP(+)) [Moraxella catarrhalis]
MNQPTNQSTTQPSSIPLNCPNLLKQACLIDGEWVGADSGEAIAVTNPFTGDVLGTIPSLSKQTVLNAVECADAAQESWANTTASERAKLLHAWADLIDTHKEDLALIMTYEQGKPITESQGEIDYANSFIRWFADEGKRIYGDVIPSTNQSLRYVVLKQPVGVCAAITPWNFPSAMIARKAAPALAAGCTMIIKPAVETPFSALALGYLAKQAGIPKGVLQIVTGKSSVVGEVLTKDPRIHKLSFTGSTEVGRVLMEQCASTIKKLSMELGGNAPFIVFDDADLEKAAEGLIASKYRNAGQTCVCANRIYVQSSIKDEFLAKFKQKVEVLKVGNGADEATDIGPLINQQALKKVQALLDDALNKGATLITGGVPHDASQLSFTPTVISDITDEMDLAHEEIFGPIAPIMTFEDENEVIHHANDTIYGLAAYFYTQNHARAWRVSEALEYGMVGQNTGLLSTEVAPFGGVKQSGFGREGSKYGIEEYITTKYWCMDISK